MTVWKTIVPGPIGPGRKTSEKKTGTKKEKCSGGKVTNGPGALT